MRMFNSTRMAAAAAAILALAGLPACQDSVSVGQPGPVSPPDDVKGSPSFALMSELYTNIRYQTQAFFDQGVLTGASMHVPLSGADWEFLRGNDTPPIAYYSIPPEAGVAPCYNETVDYDTAGVMSELTKLGPDVWRFGMPEFDQWGGCWANGRPSFAGMTGAQAYATWMSYYLDAKGLRPYLSQTAEQRGYKWMSMCSFAFCTQYAYDMGADVVLLERNIDEVSGITPGLAMMRGAARQHGDKPWGIDLSTWRYWSYMPTTFSNGQLTAGWSPTMFRRNMFIAYMGGANFIHNEASDYIGGAAAGSSLNPLAQAIQAFHDFAVKRHSDRGTPYVPMAILHDHFSGLEPKYGEWNQYPNTWYSNIPYTAGDTMFSNLLGAAYPNFSSWGRLPEGAPKVFNGDGTLNPEATQAAYNAALARGEDARKWEPMTHSRWGESFDVITDQAPLDTLKRYRVVVLATTGPMSDELRANVTQYVQQGGTVIVNAQHLSAADEAFAGIHLTGARASATSETWVPDGSTIGEASYEYAVATSTGAAVVAHTGGSPIVTKNAVGSGSVYVTTPHYLTDASAAALLNVGVKLIDTLQSSLAVVQVSGPDLEYLVTTDGGRILVTLVNTDLSGATWNGTLTFRAPKGGYSVQEWVADATIANSGRQSGDTVVVEATVPPYDVRVYVLDPR